MSGTIQRHLKQQRPFATVEEEVFVGLQLAAERTMEPWARRLRETADLSPVQYNVLRILRGAGAQGLSAGDIAERLITRSPDVTRLVDRLEKRGLVRRAPDPQDRRAVRVRITEEGNARLGELGDAARALIAGCFAGMERARLEMLRDALADVLERCQAGA